MFSASSLLAAMLSAMLVSGVPREPWPTDYVDAVEVNTVVDYDGDRRFTQIMWLHIGGPNEIVDWRFYCQQALPVCGLSFFEDKGKLRAVNVVHGRPIYSETTCDPEVERRKMQPLMFRQRLLNSPE